MDIKRKASCGKITGRTTTIKGTRLNRYRCGHCEDCFSIFKQRQRRNILDVIKTDNVVCLEMRASADAKDLRRLLTGEGFIWRRYAGKDKYTRFLIIANLIDVARIAPDGSSVKKIRPIDLTNAFLDLLIHSRSSGSRGYNPLKGIDSFKRRSREPWETTKDDPDAIIFEEPKLPEGLYLDERCEIVGEEAESLDDVQRMLYQIRNRYLEQEAKPIPHNKYCSSIYVERAMIPFMIETFNEHQRKLRLKYDASTGDRLYEISHLVP